MSEGYFLIANGEIYCERIKQFLIPSIRLFDKVRPITVLTDSPARFVGIDCAALEWNYKDNASKYELPTSAAYQSDFFTKGVFPKLLMYALTPYEHTLFLDEDVICLKDIHPVWKEFVHQASPVICAGIADASNKGPSDWHWRYLDTVVEKCGFQIPMLNSGVVYWRKSPLMFTLILKYLRNPEQYGIKALCRGTYPDEIFLAIYMGILKIRPVEHKGFHAVVQDPAYTPVSAHFVHIFSKRIPVMTAYLEDARRASFATK